MYHTYLAHIYFHFLWTLIKLIVKNMQTEAIWLKTKKLSYPPPQKKKPTAKLLNSSNKYHCFKFGYNKGPDNLTSLFL
jgi:hypothetical protein